MRVRVPTGILKFAIGWLGVFLFRLIPVRPPNFEPMMATVMPFSKRYGLIGSFLFGFLGIAIFDSVTSGWGIWTIVTALAYGIVGVASHIYFKFRPATRLDFVSFGIVATLFYDAITGLTIGPLFDGQSFSVALAGQIPFTAMHLLSTIVFAIVLSPALYRWVVENESLEFNLSFAADHA